MLNIQENLDYALTAATNSNTELIYVTDADTNENLWGRLPVYFDELVSHQTFQCSQGKIYNSFHSRAFINQMS